MVGHQGKGLYSVWYIRVLLLSLGNFLILQLTRFVAQRA